MTGRVKQAGDMLEKAYAQSLEFNDYTISADINNSLIMVYKLLKDYPGLLKCIQERERIIQNEIRRQPDMEQMLHLDFFIYMYLMPNIILQWEICQMQRSIFS